MSNKKIISRIDLDILHKILFPKSKILVIYDASGVTSFSFKENIVYCQTRIELRSFLEKNRLRFSLVNFTNESFSELQKNDLLEGIFNFKKENNASVNTFTKLLYINNPDGSMRWVFPKDNSSPCFLNLYNGSGWKAKAFGVAAKLLTTIKYLDPIVAGHFFVFTKNKDEFQKSLGGIPFDDFAIFTGTIGEDRKAIIALSEKKTCTHFVKIPLSKSSLKLVQNEFQQLDHLGQFDYLHSIIPISKKLNSGISISNVLPNQKSKNPNWSEAHWNSLEEFYKISHHQKIISSASFWKTIETGMEFFRQPLTFENGLQKETIQELIASVEKLYSNIDAEQSTSVGIGHGDFTPWNMYVGKNKLHIYDWEMSQLDCPLLFDFFHYFFQKGILIDRQNFKEIENEIISQLKNKNVQQIQQSFQVNWEEHFKLYLLYIICSYLPKYISQPKLHDQVHWLIATWIEGMNSINQKPTIESKVYH